ncbi:MAG TPA: glycosyltransferase [Solirubrobacteraceae bacterium]|nr:glycosyltransferase [Solirubrobacteraceae bacterium]
MRALVVSNMAPSPLHPGRGSFVRDQVAALRRIGDVDVELFEFAPGLMSYPLAALALRHRYAADSFDIVHAHFGLTAWPALALRAPRHVVTLHGTDLRHRRTRLITLAALGRLDLVATVSSSLAAELPAELAGRAAVLPCGVAMERFRPIPREAARLALGLDTAGPYLLFPADPSRAAKRFDRARELAGEVRLLTLGTMAPDHVTLAINAANAVLVPSDAEGYGLAVLEALACDVPVLATPVGIHEQALAGIAGTLCAPYERERWSQVLADALSAQDPRVEGRGRAAEFSSDGMARRVLDAWHSLLADPH